jgi:hypothetical protein
MHAQENDTSYKNTTYRGRRMKKGPWTWIQPMLAVVLFLGAVCMVPGAPAMEAASPRDDGKKTLNRWPDPVVIDCGIFASFQEKDTRFVRIYALTDQGFQPIPFQIDEKDPKGNRIYTSGEKANPEDANGRVDKGEELVFMARDSGTRASPDCMPPGVEYWEELELEDPLTGGKSWVYLLYAEAGVSVHLHAAEDRGGSLRPVHRDAVLQLQQSTGGGRGRRPLAGGNEHLGLQERRLAADDRHPGHGHDAQFLGRTIPLPDGVGAGGLRRQHGKDGHAGGRTPA